MTTETDERLLRRLRASNWVMMSLRTPDLAVDLERHRPPLAAPPSAAPPSAAPAEVEIVAPSPGTVTLQLAAGDAVAAGDPVATVQVHRRQATVIADAPGRVAQTCVADGEFVQHGTVVAIVTPIAS